MKPETLERWIRAFGGRRFLLTVGCGLVNSFLVWFQKISSPDFVLVTGATVAVYIAGSAYNQGRGEADEKFT